MRGTRQIPPRNVLRRALGRFMPLASGGGAPAFSPASLFTGTDEGFWAPVTTSRLWQDTARTTPVTAAGQSVASWELTTRTGVIYAEQATAGSRPVYQVDGDGAEHLDFATSRWMVTPTITPASDKAQMFAGVTFASPNGGTRVLLESSTNSDLVNGAVLAFNTAPLLADFKFRSKGNVAATADGADNLPLDTKTQVSGLGDIAGDSAIARVNGSQVASVSTDQGTGNYQAHTIFIGGRTGVFWNGRVYSIALRFGANLTAGQITDMEAWVNTTLNP